MELKLKEFSYSFICLHLQALLCIHLQGARVSIIGNCFVDVMKQEAVSKYTDIWMSKCSGGENIVAIVL